MTRVWILLLWLALAGSAFAQPTTVDLETISPAPTGEWDFEGGKFHLPETVFASLPTAGTSGRIYVVTDSSSCTSDVGTARVICRDTGSAWEAIGSGGGGGGTECSTSPCDLDSATTLGGQDICLQDGTNCPASGSYPTPTVVVTATPTPVACATDALGRGGVIAANPEKCGVPVATVTPTPTESATPTATVTSTAVACAANFVDAVVGPGSDAAATCVPIRTPVTYPTPTVVESATPTPVVCRTATVYGVQVGGLYKANPDECVGTPAPTATLGATPTYTIPFATPTPYPTPTQVLADDDGTTKGIVAFANASFDCTSGVCDLAEDYMVVGDTIQPNQLNRLAPNDQKRFFGTSDQVFLQYDSVADAFQQAGRRGIEGPTPTAPPATPTLTAATTATPTTIPTATAATATPTATTLGATRTPTPTATVPPMKQINGSLEINGKVTGPDDGSLAFPINTYGVTLSAGGWDTSATYIGVGASGGAYSAFEFQADTVATAPLKCDRMSVCLNAQNITNERVRFVLRTGPTSLTATDTLLSCIVDGNSPNVLGSANGNGCHGGTWGTSGRKGCSIKLASPILIPERYVHTISGACSGVACPSTALNGTVTLWCWPNNR